MAQYDHVNESQLARDSRVEAQAAWERQRDEPLPDWIKRCKGQPCDCNRDQYQPECHAYCKPPFEASLWLMNCPNCWEWWIKKDDDSELDALAREAQKGKFDD